MPTKDAKKGKKDVDVESKINEIIADGSGLGESGLKNYNSVLFWLINSLLCFRRSQPQDGGRPLGNRQDKVACGWEAGQGR